jgi:alanine or glycine:cation symporter, AGCS family
MNFSQIISAIDGYIWGTPLMILLIGTGIFLSIRLLFIQARGFKHACGIVTGKYDNAEDAGEISHFRALSAALSATIGTGNIVGVAAAILMGGPGAVFWMLITAIVGMATKFASCTLSTHFRHIDKDGEVFAGPMYFIERGMGPKFKWLAVLFAFFTIAASFGIGNMFQINNIAVSINSLVLGSGQSSEFINIIVGIGFASIVASVILGGIKSIGRVAAIIVPFMCLFYVLGSLYILIKNFSAIPSAVSTILYYAFHTPEAFAGGLLGTVIRSGVARGLFSNEAGLGSAPIIHGAAKTNEPVREGLVAMMEPFIDTIVICSLTALVIVVTGAYEVCDVKGELTGRAFSMGLGSSFGAKFVAVAIIFFAFSTLISWSYYGDRAAAYLFGKQAVIPYRYIYLFFIIIGAMWHIDTVINFSDAMNGLMAIPNLIALIVLSPLVVQLTKRYFRKMKTIDDRR